MNVNKFLALTCGAVMLGCLALGYTTLDPAMLIVGTGFGVLGVILWNEKQ